jgi:hypothetical protein
MRNAKQIFDEELSGEPLSEDVVVEAIRIAMKESIQEAANVAKAYTIQNSLNEGKRAAVNKHSILDLIQKL